MSKKLKILFAILILLILGFVYMWNGFGLKKTVKMEWSGIQVDVPISWVVKQDNLDYPYELVAYPAYYMFYNSDSQYFNEKSEKEGVGLAIYGSDDNTSKNVDDMKKGVEKGWWGTYSPEEILESKKYNNIDYLLRKDGDKILSYIIIPKGYEYAVNKDLKDFNLKFTK